MSVNVGTCIKSLQFSVLKTSVSYIIKCFFLDIRDFIYILNKTSCQAPVFLAHFLYLNMLSIVYNLFGKEDRNTI